MEMATVILTTVLGSLECFVLPSSSVLVVMSTLFFFYSLKLEFLSKIKLEDIIGGLSYIVQI